MTEASPAELEAPGADSELEGEQIDIGRRIEEARRRLRDTIPPREDLENRP